MKDKTFNSLMCNEVLNLDWTDNSNQKRYEQYNEITPPANRTPHSE